MKKLILSTIATVFAISSFAQDAPKTQKTPEEMSTKRADKMKTELTLNDEQRDKVYSIILDNTIKVRAVKAKYPNDKKAANAEIKPLLKSCDASIKSILTSEQAAKWETMKAEKKKEHKDKKKKKADVGY